MTSLDKEIKRFIFVERYITAEDYPFSIKPNFSALVSILDIKPGRGWEISFSQDDTLRGLLNFKPRAIYKDCNLPQNPFDKLSFDKIFLETDIAQEMIIKAERTGRIHIIFMDVDPGFKPMEKIRGDVVRFMAEGEDFISNISFISKNEIGK